ncbi:heavy-metal-associated domain-containing protein [Limibacterium fermenti]|jgi:Cu(I)/Ag(I) efflux system membrane fusion protein|uniref:heavy-metal-associated domain-containing protein n=1 Tax=Limibacterium fermenti TaxID=3229863 RepID=UPI000E85E348|nr:copper chaperone [Porphyromonadaceae bacterium]HBK32027.1 copper chaperone [Porphyromonadaceae bacterium]HBX20412.1 copper chaperone [Porphyromonadaceae bacterium]HBX45238.1 copper chaperone [Porphyromonadaceae bacterium]HCM22565.1 copper chaperone [Porphyromonadaceae bacterium]
MKKYVLSALIAATVLFAACNSNKSKSGSEESQTEATVATEHHDEHAVLGVQGLCEMCKKTIETAAKSVAGVSTADWDLDKKELHLNFDPQQTDVDAVSKAIAAAGYDTDKDKADQAAYDALPDCCKYRESL